MNSDPTRQIIVLYHQTRYLRRASDAELEQRLADIVNNTVRVGVDALIVPVKGQTFAELCLRLTECTEELRIRHGIYSAKFTGRPFKEILPFDEPRRARIKRAAQPFSAAPPRCLLRFGRLDHMQGLYNEGELMIQPAKRFMDSDIFAVQDDECSIEVKGILSTEEVRRVVANPQDVPDEERDHVINIRLNIDGYGLYCLGKTPELRMIADWGATGAVIINHPAEFEKRLLCAVGQQFPGARSYFADVNYLDPYFPPPGVPNVAKTKHFRYAYQDERRLIVQGADVGGGKLVRMGPLHDIATMVHLDIS
ncbi:hypothetical protein [Pseudooceanicola sp. 200-1SW]|uniref:hypothetical protein n=1 Tax=Pseudooceanicola sp. 200-1SW TaxID=3425949 RepID=UPI003D7FD107